MTSAFDDLTQSEATLVRERLLAGCSMAEIKRNYLDIPIRALRACRDEVFEPLLNDPEAVKALANGPTLNPLDIVRYRINPGKRPRMARKGPEQIEMFP